MDEHFDEILKPMSMKECPKTEDIVSNLNSLQGLFLARRLKNFLATVYWAEQIVKGNIRPETENT